MPLSKKNKYITTSKVKKDGRNRKQNLIESIRNSVQDENAFIYVLELSNQRNSKLKELRGILLPGRIFYGKNKVMQLALGNSPETEICENIHKLSQMIVGERALLITKEEPKLICKKLENFKPMEYAKTGYISNISIILKANDDPLKDFPGSMEPQFRQLGLPTRLKMGKIELMGEVNICVEGEPLTSNQANLLKLLGYKLVEFKIEPLAFYNDGTFKKL